MPRAKRDFIRTNIYLPKVMDEMLAKLAYMQNSTKAETTRRLLTIGIQQEAKPIAAAFKARQDELTNSVEDANIG